MELSSWGNYPKLQAQVQTPTSEAKLSQQLQDNANSIIARGLGRSYGDSALAHQVIRLASLDHFISFDEKQGRLRCYAGTSLATILSCLVSRGWFLPVTPGTKFVTIGGAIASDVHGKNHHIDGCFSQHVVSLRLALASGEVVTCSETENTELFRATCGGMGLTGIIVDAEIQLKAINSSSIKQTTFKAANLGEALDLFEQYNSATYSVAWIDCLASGEELGRSLLMIGEHEEQGALVAHKPAKLAIPFNMPGFLLNQYSISLFNQLYYGRIRQDIAHDSLHYEPYFYPLDGINNWNRLYGKNGFVQYQFVLPKSSGLEGMTAILEKIAESKRGSFLAVLKTFSEQNNNYLSFPMSGYTLALDFKIEPGLFALLDELDKQVLHYGGRLYLTKDARMSEHTFKEGYPQWQEFNRIRKEYGADKKFASHQSQRLGL